MTERRFANPRPYEALDDATRDAVHDAFVAATQLLRARGLGCAMDDRAEHLVDALALYVVESRTE